MSTSSEIFVKVKKEDFGKTLMVDLNKLKNPLIENYYPCVPVKIPENPKNDILYMGIYCHFDGYFGGVGAELKCKFNSYEDALNLVLLGSCSHIIDEIKAYHNWNNEQHRVLFWEGDDNIVMREDYLYIFRDDEWHSKCNY